MSVEEEVQQNPIFDESKPNLFKLDMPFGRKKYFIISFVIGCVTMGLGVLVNLLEAVHYLLIPFLIIVFLCLATLLYLTIINDAKRFWDLSGRKSIGLILAIGLFILNIILFFTKLRFLTFIFYVCMILVRGKLVK